MHIVLNRLELDVMTASEIYDAVEFTMKYKLPAMVVHPGLSSDAIAARSRTGGKFKIITPIDWPKGEIFGTTKLRGLALDSLEADGFEIMLTPGKTVAETKNEANALTEFIKSHLSDSTEVRFALGSSMRTTEQIADMCNGLLGVRTPAFIRTDCQQKLQVGKANPTVHTQVAEQIKQIIRAPIKVSGNINSYQAMENCAGASRLGCTLAQAKSIVKDMNNLSG